MKNNLISLSKPILSISLKLILLTCLFIPTLSLTQPSTKTVKITVPDMTCSNCSNAIKKAFSESRGFKEVEVNLKTKVVTILLNKNQNLTEEEIKKTITDLGYKVKQVEIS